MATTLIISEKPSAAQKIAFALSDGKAKTKKKNQVSYFEFEKDGKKVIVAPSVGHIFTLAPKKQGPVITEAIWKPSFKVSKTALFSKKYYLTLESLAKQADEFIAATDLDQEGEVISLNIVRFICNQKDAKRMKFSTLTKLDLQKAYFNASKTLDWGLANSGLARHFLDFIYGVNLSKFAMAAAFSASGRYITLSIGRVQGPALALLAEREREIKKFKPEPFWQIFANISIKKGKYKAIHKTDKFWKKQEAKQIFEKVKDKPAKVVKISKSTKPVLLPFPFDLTSLQIEAYRLFKITPKSTLSIAQSLYTNALISYPRTSSQKLPQKLGFKNILNKLMKNPQYLKSANEVLQTRLKPNEGKKTDPAHPAIYPTGEYPKSLKPHEFKIYDLIVKRFFSVFGSLGARENTRIEFDIEAEPFVLNGVRTTKLGWQAWYLPYANAKELELPVLKIGEIYSQKTDFEEKETQPPARFNPSSIIKELEKRQLGTKATRANIIETLNERGYSQGVPIQVTELGLKMVDTFSKYAPEILSEQLTRKFEESLAKIREGKLAKETIVDRAKKIVTQISKDFESHNKEIGKGITESFLETRRQQSIFFPCKKCKKGNMVLRISRATKKRFLACDKYPDCKTTLPLPQKGKIVKLKVKCKDCNALKIAVYTYGRRPWQLCPMPDCPSKEKKPTKEKKD